jgi:hypothetical protein
MSNHKPTARRRRPQASNPFAGRDNFPSWEEVLGESECERPQPSASPPPADLDVSYFSQASSMNMSIGARAALNEHLRHVQKYGLDVSTSQADDHNNAKATNPLDAEWDRLVESRDSPHNSSSNNISSLEDTILHESSTIEEGHESIEVMTNVSIDYFNSSCVNLLRTPTKNRLQRFNAVSTRGGETSFNQSSLLDDDDDDDDESDAGQSATMLRMFQQASVGLSPRKLTPPDQSLTSFSAVDISHISADGSEGGGGLRRSPNCSFQDFRSTIDEQPLHQSFLSYMEMTSGRDFRNTFGALSPRSSPPPGRSPRGSPPLGRSPRGSPPLGRSPRSSPPLGRSPRSSPPPGRDFRNTSGVLSLRRSPPRSSPPRSETPRRNRHAYVTPKRRQSRSSAIRVSKEKENAPTDDYFKDVIGLSPIGSRIGDPSLNGKISHPSQSNSSFSTIEGGAPSFLHNVDEATAPSLFHNINETPQTQETAESPTDLSARRVSVVEYNRTHDSEISTLNSSSAGKKKGLGSSGNIHFSPGSPLDLQDRRRYRTVVPSRVFMSETDDFPEQYDSFLSAPAPRTKPLLDSFDAAVYRSGYSDPT